MAFSAYLKIATIEGEAAAKGYEKTIECDSYSHILSQHSGGSMSAAGGSERRTRGSWRVCHLPLAGQIVPEV